MSGNEKKRDREHFMVDFPEELNPELDETSFDWEAEERHLKAEEKEKRRQKSPLRGIFK